MTRTTRLLTIVLAVEVVGIVAAVGWRMSRPLPPTVNLSRLPPATAADIERLQRAVWTDRVAAWQELGEAYLAFGYFAEAESCLRYAVRRSSQQYAAVFAHACSLERLGRLGEANEQFAAAATLTAGEQSQTCHLRRARNLLRLDEVGEAEAEFLKAPGLPAAKCAQARLLIRTDRIAEALPILEQLREQIKLDVLTEMAVTQAEERLNHPEAVLRAAERADRAEQHYLFTDHWALLQPIRNRYGLTAAPGRIDVLSQAGRHAEAADEFDRVFATTPDDFLENMVPIAVRLDLVARRPAAALKKLDWLASRMDLSPALRHLRGAALAEQGQLQLAVDEWTKANQLQPRSNTHVTLQEIFTAGGLGDKSQQEQTAAHLQRGLEAYQANRLDLALTEFQAICTPTSTDPRPWYHLGVTLFALGQTEDARQAFTQCLTLNSDYGRAKPYLALPALGGKPVAAHPRRP
jgi:tetratricopeptide (TPR) repeat protein